MPLFRLFKVEEKGTNNNIFINFIDVLSLCKKEKPARSENFFLYKKKPSVFFPHPPTPLGHS
jgi:hypothetical protein